MPILTSVAVPPLLKGHHLEGDHSVQIQLHTPGGVGHGVQASLPTVLLSVCEFRGSPARGSIGDHSEARGPSCPLVCWPARRASSVPVYRFGYRVPNPS